MNCAEMDVENIPLPYPHYNFHGRWFAAERYQLLRWWELQLTPEQKKQIDFMSIPQMVNSAAAMLEDHDAR